MDEEENSEEYEGSSGSNDVIDYNEDPDLFVDDDFPPDIQSSGKYECPICHLRTNDEEYLHRHLEECLTHRTLVDSGVALDHYSDYLLDDELLNQDFHQPMSDSPFSITCPFPKCKRKMEAYQLLIHVEERHEKDPDQAHLCPICSIQEIEKKSHEPKLNLLYHLKNRHTDLPHREIISDLKLKVEVPKLNEFPILSNNYEFPILSKPIPVVPKKKIQKFSCYREWKQEILKL